MKKCSQKITEKELQTKIISDLDKRGWIVVKTIVLSKSGFPDIFAFKNSRAIFFEVKAKNGIKSKLQQYRIKQLQSEGFTAEFVDDYDNYLRIINIFELI